MREAGRADVPTLVGLMRDFYAEAGYELVEARAAAGFAPIAIGLGLTVSHLISIPVDNTSVNPARSIAAALFAQNGALGQVWLFIVAPLIGGAIGAVLWRYILSPGEYPEQLGQVE